MASRLFSILKNANLGDKLAMPMKTILEQRPPSKCLEASRRMTTWGGGLVKPPIQVFGIEGRYATALYSAASKQNVLEIVEKELLLVLGQLKTDANFKDFILNPTFKRSMKAETLQKIAAIWKLSPTTSNLLVIMADNGRLKKLPAVIKSYETIMSAHRGEIRCEITSAAPLTDAQKKKLGDMLQTFTKNKEVIQLTSKVDPNIIGGLIISIGDRYVDMSVASKVKKYCDIIAATV